MPYTTQLHTCNASSSVEQTANKPHYTPGKALKKAFKLLGRVFLRSRSGKLIITKEQQTNAKGNNKVTDLQKCHEDEAADLNDSVLTTCSTLSDEEYENELNESAELALAANRTEGAD